MKKSPGSSAHYTGPNSSFKKNKSVGVGQDKPKMKEESARHERAESPAKERAEEKAAKKVGAGAMAPGIGNMTGMGGPPMPRPPMGGMGMGAPPSGMGGGPMGPLPPVSGPGGGGMAPPMGPGGSPKGAGMIAPAGRRPPKLARKVPTMLKRGK